MSKSELKQILERVATWPLEDQEKLALFVQEVEQWRGGDDITDDDITDKEWGIIEERAARRDLAKDQEVEEVLRRYRTA